VTTFGLLMGGFGIVMGLIGLAIAAISRHNTHSV
jgi:hypothetical protein